MKAMKQIIWPSFDECNIENPDFHQYVIMSSRFKTYTNFASLLLYSYDH